MTDGSVLLYQVFLAHYLEKFVSFNLLCQREDPWVWDSYTKSCKLFLEFVTPYNKPSYIKLVGEISNISPNPSVEHLIPLEEIKFGQSVFEKL